MKLDTHEKIKLFLEKNPKASIIDDDGNFYSLKNGQLEIIKPNYYHTWEYVKEVQKNLRGSDVNDTWSYLNSQYDDLVEREVLNSQNGSPLATLASLWEFTFYPPPEIIASIAEAYNHYMRLGGKVTLEEVFFGKPKKSIGIFSSQESKKSMVGHLNFLIRCDEINSRKTPQIQRAEETIELYKSDMDPESLLRKYRRHIKTDK